MQFLPLFFDLKNRSVLLVGGGEVALRKARLLNKPQINSDLEALVIKSQGESIAQGYSQQPLDNYTLVIAATDDSNINELVSQHAKLANIPVNVVDHPELCTFIFPAIVDHRGGQFRRKLSCIGPNFTGKTGNRTASHLWATGDAGREVP